MQRIALWMLLFAVAGTLQAQQDNDLCQDAQALDLQAGGVVAVEGSTLLFSTDADNASCGASNAPGVWYTLVGNGETLTAETCGSLYDTRLSIFEGDCDALLCVTSNDDFCGLQSTVEWDGVEGVTYLVLVHGWNIFSGIYNLTVTSGDAIPAENDADNDGYDDIALGGTDCEDYLEGWRIAGGDDTAAQQFEQLPKLFEAFRKHWSGSGIVLVKGSRFIRMERFVDAILGEQD